MFTRKLTFCTGIVALVISIVLYHKGVESDRYAFLAEWYDAEASLTRNFNLFYFTIDDTIELFDLKNQRTFLKRTSCDGVRLENLYPGGIVKIYSRQMKIINYGDSYTTTALSSKKEKTFAMIKPDAVEKMGKIMQKIVDRGFRITNLKMATMTTEHAGQFYKEHEGKPFYPFLVEYLSSGPVVAMELMAEDAIARWRETIGPTDSEQARTEVPESLRAMFGIDKSHNAVHGSASEQEARAEAAFFFPSDPLLKQQAPKTTAKLKDCTICVVKPHAVREGLVGDIVVAIKEKNFKITAMEMLYLDQLQAEAFLEVYKGVVPEYPGMLSQLLSGPCVVMEVTGDSGEGEETVIRFRELAGPPSPEVARKLKPGSIRARFGVDRLENAVHCTDLPEDGILDAQYFFELLENGHRPELTPDE